MIKESYLVMLLVFFAYTAKGETNRPDLRSGPVSSKDAEGVDTSNAAVATATSMETLDETRELLVGDVVSFRIIEDEDPIVRLIVTDSGEMEVPYIGRVDAKGKSCKNVAETIKKLLEKDFYYQATVIIGLDYNAYGARTQGRGADGRLGIVSASTGFTVMGQVQKPGVYGLSAGGEMMLSHAILQCGGFGRYADERKVKVLRRGAKGEEPTTIEVNLEKVMKRGALDKDVPLKAGDVIIVEKRLFNF